MFGFLVLIFLDNLEIIYQQRTLRNTCVVSEKMNFVCEDFSVHVFFLNSLSAVWDYYFTLASA